MDVVEIPNEHQNEPEFPVNKPQIRDKCNPFTIPDERHRRKVEFRLNQIRLNTFCF